MDLLYVWVMEISSTFTCTVEPRYNKVLGTMKITLLYQVSQYIRVKKQRNYIKSWDQQHYLVIRGFCYIRPLYNEVPLYYKFVHLWKIKFHWNFKIYMKLYKFVRKVLQIQVPFWYKLWYKVHDVTPHTKVLIKISPSNPYVFFIINSLFSAWNKKVVRPICIDKAWK